MMRVLLRRDFGLAWLGGFVSMVGSWALWIALPLHVYRVTGSTLATSGVVAAAVAPGVLFGSVAGVYVDRWNRKTTLVVANVLLAVATLPLLAVEDAARLWLVYPLVLVSAALAQFVGPAENAFLPRLVPASELLAANSLNALNNSLARLVGPALGGGAVAVGGLPAVVALDAASFAAAAGLLALVRTSGAVAGAAADADALVRGWRRTWREWRGGLSLVARERAVGVVFAFSAVAAVGEGVFGVMFVVWVRDVLAGGALELGWLHSAQAVGGIVGGALGARVARSFSAERLFGLSAIAFGLLDLALFNYPLALDGVLLGVGLMVLVGVPGIWTGAARTTILQTHVEDAFRGRVFGALATSAALLMLLGTGVAGLAGGTLGPIVLLNLQGGAYVVGGLLVLLALSGAGDARPGGGARGGGATPPLPARRSRRRARAGATP